VPLSPLPVNGGEVEEFQPRVHLPLCSHVSFIPTILNGTANGHTLPKYWDPLHRMGIPPSRSLRLMQHQARPGL